MYKYCDYELNYITVKLLICETKDLSTAYKAIISQKGTVNTSFCRQVVDDLCNFEQLYKCKLTHIIIIGDSLDRRAYIYLKSLQESGPFKNTDFEFSDKQFPNPGLKLYFYVDGKIHYIGVKDAEYEKGDYFSIEELKEDMHALYPDIPKSQLVPFYVRNWVPFTDIPDYVENAYDKYLDIISEKDEESYDYKIKVKPNSSRTYY